MAENLSEIDQKYTISKQVQNYSAIILINLSDWQLLINQLVITFEATTVDHRIAQVNGTEC